MFRLLLAD